MPTDHPESTYAVLGLIDKVPDSSGHELAAMADRSLAHFWPISRTLLYRELGRVVALGWAESERVEQTRVPSKSIYRTTSDGRRALADWLTRPVGKHSNFRSDLLLRLFFAHQMEAGQIERMLIDYKHALEVQRAEFDALVHKLSSLSSSQARFGRLSALHGLRTAEARLNWVEEAQQELGGDS